jgi:hypothetical protein
VGVFSPAERRIKRRGFSRERVGKCRTPASSLAVLPPRQPDPATASGLTSRQPWQREKRYLSQPAARFLGKRKKARSSGSPDKPALPAKINWTAFSEINRNPTSDFSSDLAANTKGVPSCAAPKSPRLSP